MYITIVFLVAIFYASLPATKLIYVKKPPNYSILNPFRLMVFSMMNINQAQLKAIFLQGLSHIQTNP